MRYAAAIFARTPGYSAAKSRLAAEVGAAAAEKLYFQSLACCAELAATMTEAGLNVCWAVAEEEAVNDRYWRTTGLPTMSSGEGQLGLRLANVHTQLLEVAEIGIMLGSDSPQLTWADLEPLWTEPLEDLPQVGPAKDGGFYLFADRQRYSTAQWEKVEYSTQTTLAQLEEALAIKPHYLSQQPDFDDIKSLAQVVTAMPANPTAAQQEFRSLATELLDPGLLEAVSSSS